jgi:hypothetical protein
MIPHDYVLSQILGEIDDAIRDRDETWQRFLSESAPIIRRFHAERFLRLDKAVKDALVKLVEIRT